MATAANVVKLKRSAVAGRAPATTDLQLGELALNTYDGRVYLKKSVSAVESIVRFSCREISPRLLSRSRAWTFGKFTALSL